MFPGYVGSFRLGPYLTAIVFMVSVSPLVLIGQRPFSEVGLELFHPDAQGVTLRHETGDGLIVGLDDLQQVAALGLKLADTNLEFKW